MRLTAIIAAAFFSASGIASAAGFDQSKVLSSAGLTVPRMEIPSPQPPQRALFSFSPKIRVNQAHFNMADTVVLTLDKKGDIGKAMKLLKGSGYKITNYTDTAGGRLVMADIKDSDGPEKARLLAKYDFITEVQVNQAVYSALAYNEAPKSPGNNQQNMALRKIKVNEAQPDMNDTLVGLIQHGQDIDTVVRELTEGGFKAYPCQDNHGGYMVMVDVKGLDAAGYALGLAKYYYVAEVLVGRKVYDRLFELPSRSMSAANNQQNMAFRKMRISSGQADDVLIGMISGNLDLAVVVKEINQAGLKAAALTDGSGVSVDASGIDAADAAIGLAKFYYVTEVLVSPKIYAVIFAVPE